MNNKCLVIILLITISWYANQILACSGSAIPDELDDKYLEFSNKYLIRDNLFINSKDELFFRFYNVLHVDGKYAKKLFRFQKRFRKNPDAYNLSDNKKLTEIVDPVSWRQLNWHFYRDKNHIYCSDRRRFSGFLFHLEGVKADDFKAFYQGEFRSFDEIYELYEEGNEKLENKGKNEWLARYFTDGKKVFFDCKEIQGADQKPFGLLMKINYLR